MSHAIIAAVDLEIRVRLHQEAGTLRLDFDLTSPAGTLPWSDYPFPGLPIRSSLEDYRSHLTKGCQL